MYHQNHIGQSFRTPVQRDAGFSLQTPQPFSVRPYAQAWLLAEHRRDIVWQDGANLPAAYPSAISGRTQNPDTEGRRGNQWRAGSPQVEEFQGS